MPEESHTIVAGIVIAIIVLLIAATFILVLVTYANKRKNLFLREQENLRLLFQQQLLQSRLEMQEQTFNSISREIHDNVGQVLSLAKVQVNIMEQQGSYNESLLSDIKESVSKAMDDLRDIARSLNSDRIRLYSLPEMVKHELQRIQRLGTIKTFFFTDGAVRSLGEHEKLIVFRIIQESLQNILKHAAGTAIEVSCRYSETGFTCSIMDNGKGFDHQLLQQDQGLGLQNMYNRAALIGATLNVTSVIGKGTTITIDLPYDK